MHGLIRPTLLSWVYCLYLALIAGACSDEIGGPNRRPVALAPPDQVVDVDQPAFLDGSASFDPDNDELGYRWRVLAGTNDSPYELDGDRNKLARFTAHAPGTWLIELVVSDASLDSHPAISQVRVKSRFCQDDGECDDGDPCTVDACASGTCQSEPGNDGAVCDDRNACTMNDSCQTGVCGGEPLDADGDSYVSADCQGSDCNDDDAAIHPGAFEGPAGSALCQDQIDNDCDDSIDELDSGCEACTQDADCDDGNLCNGQERCVSEACLPGTPLVCSDFLQCTRDECDPQIGCVYPPVDDGTPCGVNFCTDLEWFRQTCQSGECTGSVLVENCDDGIFCTRDECHDFAGCLNAPLLNGTGCDEGDGADGNPCNSSCFNGACSPDHPAAVMQPCDDGYSCSQPDYCDGQGMCQGTLLSTLCNFGQICLPRCSPDDSGCVNAPSAMSLNCEDSVVFSDNVSHCVLDAGDAQNAGLASCLTCQARVAMTELAYADFENVDGDCSRDGWELSPDSGLYCTDNLTGCNAGAPRECCADFGSLCYGDLGGQVLRSNKASNCGGGVEEWRLFRFFNTLDLFDLRVCFDYAEDAATNNDTIMVAAVDPGDVGNPEIIFCMDDGPAVTINRFFYRFCVDLPDWTEDRNEVIVAFALHSNDNNDVLYLDNLEVTGWGGGCAGGQQVVLHETFDGCDWSEWLVSGGIDCPAIFSCDSTDSIMAANETWTIERTVDASSLDSHVELCFDHGDKAADSGGESLTALIDTGGGWQVVWQRSGQFGPDNTCRQVCVNLSEFDPAVNNHPALGLRFRLGSDRPDDNVVLDNVILRGASYCPAEENLVQLSTLVDQGNGNYTFSVIDTPYEQLTTRIDCHWDPQPSISADSTVWFRY